MPGAPKGSGVRGGVCPLSAIIRCLGFGVWGWGVGRNRRPQAQHCLCQNPVSTRNIHDLSERQQQLCALSETFHVCEEEDQRGNVKNTKERAAP